MEALESNVLQMGRTVQEQLTDALAAFSEHDVATAEQVVVRDDVVDNLRSGLEERCFELLSLNRGVLEQRRARSALRVIYNLERIGDAASHIAKHCLMQEQEGDSTIPLPIGDLTQIALSAVDEGVRSFAEADLALARTACERESELDRLYIRRLEEIAGLIDASSIKGAAALHLLAVLKYLEKVCDFALNIGETTVFSLTGTRLSYPQFQELQALLPSEGDTTPTFRHFWDGISGATVLEVANGNGARTIFKEGTSSKIEEEFVKTIEWEDVAPGHTARVIGITHSRGRNGILREFAEGSLLLDLLLTSASADRRVAAMRPVCDVLVDIWTTTITPRPPAIDYTGQIRSKLRELLRRHPDLERKAKDELAEFGGLYDMLTQMAKREAWLAPPFSIWTHGDLNANNIVVDQDTDSVVFIDVHRSRYGDYLQDVAVLATSPVRAFPKGAAARGVKRANDVLLQAAETFAKANNDQHYKLRLRIARARALITSARLQNDEDRAEELFMEGLKLLKKVARAFKLERVK
jgi:phosphate transport system regulatory protein PhoU